MSEPEATSERLQTLLNRLEDARKRLEEADDSEAAVDVLKDLVDLAKEVQVEVDSLRRRGPDAPAG